MFNFNGGNDLSMYNYMQNCIQSAFSPLFSSYQNSLILNAEKEKKKIDNYKEVYDKIEKTAGGFIAIRFKRFRGFIKMRTVF